MMKKYLYILLFTISLFHTSLLGQWVQQPIPTAQQVQDLHFLDSLHGWLACSNGAVNDSGLILYTSTGGASWIKQYDSVSSPLFAVKMADLNTGYCVGGYRKILKTTNAGQNWMNTNITVGAYFKDIAVIDPMTFYVCVEDSPFYGILKTTNGGLNYTIQFTGNCNILNFINAQTGWAATSNFVLRSTTNGGTNWVTVHNFLNDGIGDIFFTDENTGWLSVSGSTGMQKTTNGGLNFIAQTLPSGSFGFGGLFFINSNTGWSGGAFYQIHKTSNGGINWILYTGLPVYSSNNICFIDSLKGWCSSSPYNIAKTTNGGVMGLGQVNTEIPKTYSLKQNYPNPFNSQTMIEFSISRDSYVELNLFDVLGKVILLYESKSLLNAGSYKFPVYANDLSSGMYFYKITVTNLNDNITYTDTKKMVLIK